MTQLDRPGRVPALTPEEFYNRESGPYEGFIVGRAHGWHSGRGRDNSIDLTPNMNEPDEHQEIRSGRIRKNLSMH